MLCSPDKEELVRAAKAIETTILGVEKEELPESVEPVLSEESVEFKRVSIDTWVRQDPEKTESQVGAFLLYVYHKTQYKN